MHHLPGGETQLSFLAVNRSHSTRISILLFQNNFVIVLTSQRKKKTKLILKIKQIHHLELEFF